MTITDQVPTTPQAWNRNPDGYVKHQHLLVQLIEWFESKDADIRLPEDRGGPDGGIDLWLRDTRIDLKSFGLDAYRNTLTWRSTYYRGRPAPIWDTLETDWFVHPTPGPVSEWTIYHRSDLKTSKFGYAPYVFKDAARTLGDFMDDLNEKEIELHFGSAYEQEVEF